MQKLFIKKRKKKEEEMRIKMDKYPRYLKWWVLRCSPGKKEERKE